MKTLHLAMVTFVIAGIILLTTFQNIGAINHYEAHLLPSLTPSENQTIIDTALSVPGLQNWSHSWQYVLMGFGSNKELGTPYFMWEYASVVLKAPSSSAPVPCNNDWWATIVIDMTTMKVVNATYPTLESHSCRVATGGGPESIGLESSSNTTNIESPLQQFKSGIKAEDVKCNQGFQLIIKTENGSPACVTPDTAQKLIERGWAKSTQVNSMLALANSTGTITLGNRTYYFETPTYIHDSHFNSSQISFHDVTFTLFPTGFRGGLPIPCGMQGTDQYYWTDARFADGAHELLHILVSSPPCTNSIPSMFSNHTNPQAGLAFYDGKMKVLVSTGSAGLTGN